MLKRSTELAAEPLVRPPRGGSAVGETRALGTDRNSRRFRISQDDSFGAHEAAVVRALEPGIIGEGVGSDCLFEGDGVRNGELGGAFGERAGKGHLDWDGLSRVT
mgnify:CR=1 FL=1